MEYNEKRIKELEETIKKNTKSIRIMGGVVLAIALVGAIMGRTTIFGIFAGLLALIPFSTWEKNKELKEELTNLYEK